MDLRAVCARSTFMQECRAPTLLNADTTTCEDATCPHWNQATLRLRAARSLGDRRADRPVSTRRCTSLWYALPMKSAMKSMPNPRELARDFTNPFVYVLGGLALFLAVLNLIVGQNPAAPVASFLTRSAETLLPLAQSLMALWLCYLVVYLLLSAYVYDLWIVARVPAGVIGFLRRSFFTTHQGSALPISLIFPLSPVRLYRPYIPEWQINGWRAGYSAQLE